MILFIFILIFLVFASVILFGAPYLPTLSRQVQTAVDLLELEQNQLLLELGCGDGRVLKVAAKRGIRSIGYELNPFLVIIAKLNTFRYRDLVKVKWANYWTVKWPEEVDGVYVFLLDKYMDKLNIKLTEYSENRNIKLVSYGFQIEKKTPVKSKNGLFLYNYEKS